MQVQLLVRSNAHRSPFRTHSIIHCFCLFTVMIVRSTHWKCGWTDSECPFERTCLFVRTHTPLWHEWFNQEMIFRYEVSAFWTHFEFVQNTLLAWLNSLLFEHDFTRDLLGFYLWFIYGESHSRKASTSWFLMYSNDLPCILLFLFVLRLHKLSFIFVSYLRYPALSRCKR